MTLRRSHVINTPTPGEFIAVYIGEDGQPMNVTITDHELNAELVATPTHLSGAVLDVTEDEDVSTAPVNPDRAELEGRIFGKAEEILAERAKAAEPKPDVAEDDDSGDTADRVVRPAKPKPPAAPVRRKRRS